MTVADREYRFRALSSRIGLVLAQVYAGQITQGKAQEDIAASILPTEKNLVKLEEILERLARRETDPRSVVEELSNAEWISI